MSEIWLYIRSFVFFVLFYGWMVILGILGAIPALFSKEACYWVLGFYCKSVFFFARVVCGLRFEIRGEVPSGSIVVASKHQSFFDILIIFSQLERPTFILKKELKWAPFLGWYAMRIGCTPVDRSGKSGAVSEMVKSASETNEELTQLVIYPQGTRVKPGDKKPYKVGAAVLAQRMARPVALAATNVGVFWPRRGIRRDPGVAVVEFLGMMPEDLDVEEATAYMEKIIEPASDKLVAEARKQLAKN